MSSEQQRLGLNGNFSGFYFQNRYETPDNNKHFQQQTRSFASTRGLEIEACAVRTIINHPQLSVEEYSELSESIDQISIPLKRNLLSIEVPDGKTLAHSAVLPFYLKAFIKQKESVESLAETVDQYFGLKLSDILGEISKRSNNKETMEVRRSEIKYFLDALLIMSRLLRDGIGQDLSIFGQLIPNVQIRNLDGDGKKQVTQLDGVFVPTVAPLGDLSDTLEREKLIRSFAKVENNFPPSVPPIIRLPFLEIKANFRPRWTFGRLPQHVTPYIMKEVTDRLALSIVDANLVIAPPTIVVVRLRSLGPNYVYHFHPTASFYEAWRDDILIGLQIHKNNSELTDKLANLLPFIEWEGARLRSREDFLLIRHEHPEAANQVVLGGIDVPTVNVEKQKIITPRRPRPHPRSQEKLL